MSLSIVFRHEEGEQRVDGRFGAQWDSDADVKFGIASVLNISMTFASAMWGEDTRRCSPAWPKRVARAPLIGVGLPNGTSTTADWVWKSSGLIHRWEGEHGEVTSPNFSMGSDVVTTVRSA